MNKNMKKIFSFGLVLLGFSLFSTTYAVDVPDANLLNDITTRIDEAKKITDLASQKERLTSIQKTAQDALNIFSTDQTISDAINKAKDIQKEIQKMEQERNLISSRIRTETGTTKAASEEERKKLNTQIETKKQALKDTETVNGLSQENLLARQQKIQQAVNAANNALRTNHQQQEAKKLVKDLGKTVDSSSSFDVDDFLSVGNEKDLNLNPNDTSDKNLLNRILKYIIQLVGTFGVVMMIVAGFFMVTSEGDENRLQKGKNIFLYTIIGIIVAFTSYALIQLVLSVLFK